MGETPAPTGWTADEGPFGEFSHITGEIKWNPIFRVRAITHRRDPIFYVLQMPWENDWLAALVIEAAGLQALRMASVQPVAIRAPVGSCCYWSLIASIKTRPGERKNALLALLSVAEVTLAIVTDEDIDIDDPEAESSGLPRCVFIFSFPLSVAEETPPGLARFRHPSIRAHQGRDIPARRLGGAKCRPWRQGLEPSRRQRAR